MMAKKVGCGDPGHNPANHMPLKVRDWAKVEAIVNTTGADVFVTLMCAAVVTFYSARRFNTPETNQFSTTRWLFRLTAVGYMAASVSIFFFLCEIVLKPGVLSFIGLDHAQEAIAKYSAPPVLAAALLTTLLPNAVYLKDCDAWLLKCFQAWGRIPLGVRRLAETLTPQAYQVCEADISELRTWIKYSDDVPNEFAARVNTDTADTSRGSLTRILGLYRELKSLEELSAYTDVFRERGEAWSAIRTDFRVFVAQSQAFFVLFDHLALVDGPTGEDALKKARGCYQGICLKLHKHMVEFLAQLLLIVEGSNARIRNELQAIGFNVADTLCPPLPLGALAFMGLVMIVAILGIVSVVPSEPQALPLGIIAVLIGTTKTIALFAAILPKLRWRQFRPDSNGNLPYLAWMASASFAAALSLLIDRAALAMAAHHFAVGFDFVNYPLSPMGPMSFALSLSVAIICDLDLDLSSEWVRRVVEGVLCGVAMVLGIFICTHLPDLRLPTQQQMSFWFPFAFSFSLGFGSGLFAPFLYRRARNEEPMGQTIAFAEREVCRSEGNLKALQGSKPRLSRSDASTSSARVETNEESAGQATTSDTMREDYPPIVGSISLLNGVCERDASNVSVEGRKNIVSHAERL
jgi:hypothetical protein